MILSNFVYLPQGLGSFVENVFDKVLVIMEIQVSSKISDNLMHPQVLNGHDPLLKSFDIFPKRLIFPLFDVH